MKICKSDEKLIIEKTNKLEGVKKQLKKEFIGIDEVIDEVIQNIESWYLFPEAQIRPTIINLWGMTGTGKTSLILRLFNLLELDTIVRFDVGDWLEEGTYHNLKEKISSQVRKIKRNESNNIPIFIFDEFQLGRTISEDGVEEDRSGVRIIWDLIDSGKFETLEETWETECLFKLYIKLNHLVDEYDIQVKNGAVVKNLTSFNNIFKDEINKNDKKIPYIKNAFISEDNFKNIQDIWYGRFLSRKHLSDYIKKLNNEKNILNFIDETIHKSMKPINNDFSNSIIFNIGNLDEAFTMSSQLSPDIDADSLFEFSKKITVTDIKESLRKRFRNEQIGRLGNTHVIFKGFKTQDYKDLISLELSKIKTIIKNKFDIDFIFSDSVHELIYKEGVFASQGVRPLFSTIKSLIESYIGKIISDILKKKLKAETIGLIYQNNKYTVNIYENKMLKITSKLEYKVDLKIDSLRQSKNTEEQALIAIHEAGHAIVSIFALKLCPKIIMSRTADSSEGFCHIEFPEYETREYIINKITMLIAGLIAEEEIFGKKNVSAGSYSDLSNATKSAVELIKNYGMSDYPFIHEHKTVNNVLSNDCTAIDLDKNDLSLKIIKDCSFEAGRILNSNKKLLCEMGDYLTNNSKMDEHIIKEFVEKYGSEKIKYKTKDNYYNFKEFIKKLKDEYNRNK